MRITHSLRFGQSSGCSNLSHLFTLKYHTPLLFQRQPGYHTYTSPRLRWLVLLLPLEEDETLALRSFNSSASIDGASEVSWFSCTGRDTLWRTPLASCRMLEPAGADVGWSTCSLIGRRT
jgi:hypothetical protein